MSVGGETVLYMTATLGYARVSTLGQDPDAQRAALIAAGVDSVRLFTNKLSGSAKTARPGLAAMLDYARPGDTLVLPAIDRLGRSVAEVTRTIATLGERRITLRALREGVDTSTPAGRAVAAIMATLAELELELGRERRAASRESHRARRLPVTKPPKLSPGRQEQLRRLAATGERCAGWPRRSELGGPPPIATSRGQVRTDRDVVDEDDVGGWGLEGERGKLLVVAAVGDVVEIEPVAELCVPS